MLLETRQVAVTIVARQRGLFAKNFFLRTNGLFSPSLWRAALDGAPAAISDSATFLSDRTANVVDRVNGGRRAQFFAVLFAIAASVALALFMARRVVRRSEDESAPTPLRKAAAAGWTALVIVAAPVAAVGALSLAFDAYDLIDAALEPIWRRFVEGVARIAFAYAIARAVLAPAHPNWRLIDPGDRLAKRLTQLVTLAAVTLSAARFLEQLEESVQGGLPLVIVTRGLGVMIVAALIAIALFNLLLDRPLPLAGRKCAQASRELVAELAATLAGRERVRTSRSSRIGSPIARSRRRRRPGSTSRAVARRRAPGWRRASPGRDTPGGR